MTLFKTSLLGASAFAARLFSNLVLNKVLAISIGPGGFALIGQIQSLLGICQSLAGGFLATGVTRGIAALGSDEHAIAALSKTAIFVGLLLSSIFAVAFFAYSEPLSSHFLLSSGYVIQVRIAALVLPIAVIGLLLLAILNGRKLNVAYTVISILASVAGVILIACLSLQWGLPGAISGVILVTCLPFLLASLYSSREKRLRISALVGRADGTSMRMLLGPALMAITAACVAPLIQIALRTTVISELGLHAAGYWQAVWKFSELFMLLFTTSLAIYYLPRLAEIKTEKDLLREVIGVSSRVLPVAAGISLVVILLREYIVIAMLSRDFSPVADLIPWQLGADLIKLGSWIAAYVMIARALVVQFIVCELCFGVIFWILADQFLATHGLVGIAIAQSVTYFLYWVVAGVLAWKEAKRLGQGPVQH